MESRWSHVQISSIVTIKCLAQEEQNQQYQSTEDGYRRNESYVIYQIKQFISENNELCSI